jgi:protein kinase
MHRYNTLSQLGDGAFGVVTKAQQVNTNEIVAVKRMKQRFQTWEECLQLREITSLRRLQHTNIIKLKEVVRENTELFMIFEFMDGNVYQLAKQRADQSGGSQGFNEKEIRSIICQTLLGLQAVHKAGFMHRDLKPENLLIKGDLVKIADFGLAKEIRSRPPFTEYVSTRWYRAPEIVLRSTHYNSPIDIWAAGVIFAELYLNRPLFPGASDSDQLFKICSVLGTPGATEWDEGYQLARKLNVRFPSMGATPLRSLIPHASPAAIDLIEAMLRFNPSERPTASQCLQHPFFSGAGGDPAVLSSAIGGGGGSFTLGGSATSTGALFQGIASGLAHNPFQLAAGAPAPSGMFGPSMGAPGGGGTGGTSSRLGQTTGGGFAIPGLPQGQPPANGFAPSLSSRMSPMGSPAPTGLGAPFAGRVPSPTNPGVGGAVSGVVRLTGSPPGGPGFSAQPVASGAVTHFRSTSNGNTFGGGGMRSYDDQY